MSKGKNEFSTTVNNDEWTISQSFGTFLGEPMGSLYYCKNGKVVCMATITEQLTTEQLKEHLHTFVCKRYETSIKTYEKIKKRLESGVENNE